VPALDEQVIFSFAMLSPRADVDASDPVLR